MRHLIWNCGFLLMLGSLACTSMQDRQSKTKGSSDRVLGSKILEEDTKQKALHARNALRAFEKKIRDLSVCDEKTDEGLIYLIKVKNGLRKIREANLPRGFEMRRFNSEYNMNIVKKLKSLDREIAPILKSHSRLLAETNNGCLIQSGVDALFAVTDTVELPSKNLLNSSQQKALKRAIDALAGFFDDETLSDEIRVEIKNLHRLFEDLDLRYQ